MDGKDIALGLLGIALLLLLMVVLWMAFENSGQQSELRTLGEERDALRVAHRQLSEEYLNVQGSYASLQAEYTRTNASYRNLSQAYIRLYQERELLRQEYENLSLLRLPEEIPSASSLGSMEFLLTSRALIINYPNLRLVSGENTTSMHPTISIGHLAIASTAFDPDTLQIGDIVAYDSSLSNVPIAHRIVGTRNDENGLCYLLRGDNNPVNDPGCIRPSQILYQVIGVLYSANPEGYRNCLNGYAGLALDGELECIPPEVEAGVYLTDQSLVSGSRYPFCEESNPARPYTMVTPDGEIYCYRTLPS